MKDWAEKYYQAGLSIVPLFDGKKHPTIAWGESQNRIVHYNFEKATGVALVSGKVSGQGLHLEIIDFDIKNELEPKSLMKRWIARVKEISPDLLSRVLIEETKSGGFHIAYRTHVWAPSEHLAMRHGSDQEQEEAYQKAFEKTKDEQHARRQAKNYHRILVETLSSKHPCTIYPTEGYTLRRGDWTQVPEISAEDRNVLLDAARELNEFYPEPDPVYEDKSLSAVYSESPFEAYNQTDAFLQVLEQNGWKRLARSRGKYVGFVAPDSKSGMQNASYRQDNNRFYVFTPNTLLQPNVALSPVDIYLTYRASGDKKQAYSMLLSEGYGKKADRAMPVPFKTGQNGQPHKPTEMVPADQQAATIQLEAKATFMDWKPRYTADDLSWVARRESYEDYLERVRNGTFEMGLETFTTLDKYFRFKKGLFVPINGHDNVGKTVAWIYILLLAVLNHKWKIGLITNENSTGGIVRKILEFVFQRPYGYMSKEQQEFGTKWVDEHFYIVDIEGSMTHYDVMDMGTVLVEKFGIDALLVDPYNSLDNDEGKMGKMNSHEYHYKILGLWRRWTKKYKCTMYVCCHAVTSATRLKSKDGRPIPPGKADTEQGSKFAARADDFITIHRDVSGEGWRTTEIHVRKVKEVETGGRPSPYDEPFCMEMIDGCRFVYGTEAVDPIKIWHDKNPGVFPFPLSAYPKRPSTTKPEIEPEFIPTDELPF